MFFIQVNGSSFVNADDINHLHFRSDGAVNVSIRNEPKGIIVIQKENAVNFLDDLCGADLAGAPTIEAWKEFNYVSD